MGNRKPEGLSRYELAKRYAKVRGTGVTEQWNRGLYELQWDAVADAIKARYTDKFIEDMVYRDNAFLAMLRKAAP